MHETNIKTEQLSRNPGELYQIVETEMLAVRRRISSELSSDIKLVDTLCRYAAQYQGKMLRPAILLLAGKACGDITPRHIDFAVILELVHLATLIHDDVLDEAKTRRQLATVNQLWGNESSVLLGDLLLSQAFDLCNRTGDLAAAGDLSHTAKTVCQGELCQCLNRKNWELTEEQYLQIIEMKTASLYQLSCRLGAKFSNASAQDQAVLEEFGRLFGCGFQIADDLLDLVGREDQTGKTLGTDLAQGKPTLPIIHFCRQADPAAKKEFFNLFRAEETPTKEILSLLDRSGSLKYAWQRAGGFGDQAQTELLKLKAGPARDSLASIAEFVVKRSC
ncbi:MAG: polyprenyl synthetase family protein [Phycisphaerae bacterium]